MYIIGLTGSIAAGKTSVSRYLTSLGAHVLCADEMSREVALTPSVLAEIMRVFGPEMILPNGELNRRALSERIFSDEYARAQLDAIMHPLIIANIRAQLAQLEMTYPEGVAVVDAALLIEAGVTAYVDEVWLVTAPDETRMQRLMRRDAITSAQAQMRFVAQMPQEQKRSYATDIIDNGGDWDATSAQLEALWTRLLSEPCPFGAEGHAEARARAQARREERMRMETLAQPTAQPSSPRKGRLKTWLLVGVIMIALAVAASLWVNREMELRTYKLNYPELVLQYASEYDLDPVLVAALIHVESGNRETIASPKGAVGLMQIMPDTGEWIADKLKMPDYSAKMLQNPEVNVRFGCWYLRFLEERFANTDEVLAAYNAGQGNVAKWLSDPTMSDDGVTLRRIPFKETEQYVERIQRAYVKYQYLYQNTWKQAAPYEKAYAL